MFTGRSLTARVPVTPKTMLANRGFRFPTFDKLFLVRNAVGTVTIDIQIYGKSWIFIAGEITINFANPPPNLWAFTHSVVLVQTGTGNHVINFPVDTYWENSIAPILSIGLNARDDLLFEFTRLEQDELITTGYVVAENVGKA
jgi:hypothetical protein